MNNIVQLRRDTYMCKILLINSFVGCEKNSVSIYSESMYLSFLCNTSLNKCVHEILQEGTTNVYVVVVNLFILLDSLFLFDFPE